jgi:arylsulfatase A-like enzyme
MPDWQPRWRWPMEALPYLSDLYDAEIAFNDDSFGRLLDFLVERGLYDDTLIIFASDHGEEFKEHGRWRHGANLHAETLNFPLIVKFPDQQVGTRVETAVQHIDLLPTILASVGLEIPEALEGRDLAAIAAGHSPATELESSGIYSHLRLGRGPLNHSLVSEQWKLIRRQGEDEWEVSLFDWREDPAETRNLATDRPVLAAVLSALIDQKVASLQESEAAEEVTLSQELEEDLRALGYLE